MLKTAGIAVLSLAWAAGSDLSAQPQSMREAAQLDAAGRCEESEAYYQAELQRGSPSAALLNNTGNHYLVCGQSDKAQIYFEKLLQVNPQHANANLQLARISTEQKQGAKALEYLARVEETGPLASLLRAEANYWAEKKHVALALLDSVEKQAAGEVRLLFMLGLSSARLGLYDRAEAAFNGALALRPGEFDILFNLGRAAARAQHYDRAERALEAALKIRPGDVDLLLELGAVCVARQNHARAVFLLAQARQKAPGNANVLRLLAQAAHGARYFEDAADTYDEYMRLHPEDDAARRDRARAYASTETRRQQARKEFEWYLAKHPGDALGHFFFAEAFWKSAPDEALGHLTEAVGLSPDSVSMRFSRAWMLQRMGRMEESLSELKTARELAPKDARILDMTGLAHLALDQPAEAETVLRQALAVDPDNPEIVMHLGRAVMALGREDEARNLMDRYRAIRPPGAPGLRPRSGMIELATLPAPEQRKREIEHFRQMAGDHPDRPTYQLHLASLLLADGRKEEALEEFRVLLGRNANHQIWARAGSLLLRSSEYALARDFLQRAAAGSSAARLDLAIALFYADGPEQALASLDKLPAEEATGDVFLLKADVLHSMGRQAEAEQALNEGMEKASSQPQVAEQAVPLLVRLDRRQDALDLLAEVIRKNPEDSDLPLLKAIVLGLVQQFAEAEKTLREIELRWPEWDRAYLAHGLLLELAKRPSEARQRLRTAAALGSQDPGLACAEARLAGEPEPAPECACLKGLEQMLFPRCAERN
jgi:tetratricopeptide (TPR) repeat protein